MRISLYCAPAWSSFASLLVPHCSCIKQNSKLSQELHQISQHFSATKDSATNSKFWFDSDLPLYLLPGLMNHLCAPYRYTHKRTAVLRVKFTKKGATLQVIRVCGTGARAIRSRMLSSMMEAPSLEWRVGSPSNQGGMHKIRSFVVLHDFDESKLAWEYSQAEASQQVSDCWYLETLLEISRICIFKQRGKFWLCHTILAVDFLVAELLYGLILRWKFEGMPLYFICLPWCMER